MIWGGVMTIIRTTGPAAVRSAYLAGAVAPPEGVSEPITPYVRDVSRARRAVTPPDCDKHRQDPS